MNTFSRDNRLGGTVGRTFDASTTALVSRKLERADMERLVKTAVQSGSPGQVDELDAALLVGCVDWYQYAFSGSERRAT
jgi:hypothetical protein